MATPVTDLWPEDLADERILTPLAILRVQASSLRERTKGLIEAQVVTECSGEYPNQRSTHYFDLVATALGRYRHRLLAVVHPTRQVYPADLESPYLERGEWKSAMAQEGDRVIDIWSQEALNEGLAAIFRSHQVRALIHSILAQSYEAREGNAA